MSEVLHFLPWLRRGLGLWLTDREDGRVDLPRSAPVDAWLTLGPEHVQAAIALRPADHVVGLDASQIVRRYPGAGAAEAEYGYFPLVEVSAPDLPWVVTPLAPDESPDVLGTASGRLRPWVVLVCVEEASADLVPSVDGGPQRLLVSPDQLPDLSESYAWVHVQSAVPPADVVAALDDQPGAVVARLVCPRRLAPDTSYRAALVAAFTPEGDTLAPAWSPGGGDAELLVYDTWTFATGHAGSFEELCERLGPVEDPTLRFGTVRTDMTDLGSVDPWRPDTGRKVIDYAGALVDAGITPEVLPPRARQQFGDAVRGLLNQGDVRLELAPDAPDPVVTPPFVGAYAARRPRVPADHWLHDVNLDPNHRAAAGLGAEVVRANQERFMARAWQQAGQVRETNRQLSFTRLQVEVGRTAKGRIDRLDPVERVSLLRAPLSFVRDENGDAPRRLLRSSTIPDGLLSPVYLRVVRPGGVVARAVAKRVEKVSSLGSAMGEAFNDWWVRDELGFGAPPPPDGMVVEAPLFDPDPNEVPPGEEEPPDPDGPLPERRARRRRRAGRRNARTEQRGDRPTSRRRVRRVRSEVVGGAHRSEADDTGAAGTLELDAVATMATAEIRPMDAARSRIEARIPALAGVLVQADVAEDELPTRVLVGPSLSEALSGPLLSMSAELLMPGVESFPDNAVRVVETNTAYVAAFLAGANHEMTRELLWREYPADPGSTTFRRFWDRPRRTDIDIRPMASWLPWEELADLGATGSDSVVLLLRGDLIRHYPTLRVLLRDPAGNETMPSFGGWIPPDVRFIGFDVQDADVVTAPGTEWEVVLEEQVTEPRFGLDTTPVGEEPGPLDSWDDLSWEHLTGQDGGPHLTVGSGAFPSPHTPPSGATWGLNSAHIARATYQKPYRYRMPVAALLGEST